MAGGKETPRQKMIGMMYLVLTALLALNVSKEILNSFILINDSLVVTNKNFANKNQSQYNAFDKALLNDKEKVQKWYDMAMDVKSEADGMVAHIEDLKQYLIMRTDKLDSLEIQKLRDAGNLDSIASIFSLRNVNSKDNYDIATNIMIGGNEAKLKEGPHTAFELVEKLNKYRDNLISKISPAKGQSIIDGLTQNFNTDTSLRVSDSEFETWPMANFYHIPLAAVVTNLSKIQTDVRNAESDVVKYLYREVDASDFKFDVLTAKVIGPNLVFVGDDYKADIFVAAYSSTQNPVVEMGKVDTANMKIIGKADTSSVDVGDGVGVYSTRASREGLQKYEGLIKIKNPSGDGYTPYHFESEYMVMKSSVVVSPTKMNVLYRGVKNPVSISVPGVAPELVKANMTNGSLRADSKEGKGNYIAEVKGANESTVSVTAEIDGKQRKMGEFKFRVKNVPPPVATVAGTESGLVSANRLAAAPTVIPKMKDFDFELYYKVTKFDLVYQVGTDLITKPVVGSAIPQDAIGQIKRLKKGSRVYIENIKAIMLDENNRPATGVTPVALATLSLKIS